MAYYIQRDTQEGVIEVAKVNNLEFSGKWLGDCFLSVELTSPVPVDFQIGDYIVYLFDKYTLDYDPSIIKSARSVSYGGAFKYSGIRFNNCHAELKRCSFLNTDAINEQYYYSAPNFNLHCDTVNDFADKIQFNLDRFFGKDVWEVSVQSGTQSATNIDLEIQSMTVWDALGLISSKFKTSFYVRDESVEDGKKMIYIGGVVDIDVNDFNLSYGKGNGITSIERNSDATQNIITKLRAYGNSQGLPTNYYSEPYEPWIDVPCEPLDQQRNLVGWYYGNGIPTVETAREMGLATDEDTSLTYDKKESQYKYICLPFYHSSQQAGADVEFYIYNNASDKKSQKSYIGKGYTFKTKRFVFQDDCKEHRYITAVMFDMSEPESVELFNGNILDENCNLIVVRGIAYKYTYTHRDWWIAEKPIIPTGLGVNNLMLPWYMWYKATDNNGNIYALDPSRYELKCDNFSRGYYIRTDIEVEDTGKFDDFFFHAFKGSNGATKDTPDYFTDVYVDGSVVDNTMSNGTYSFNGIDEATNKYGMREGIMFFDNDDNEYGNVYPTFKGLKYEDVIGAGYNIEKSDYDNRFLDEVVFCSYPNDDGMVYKNDEGVDTYLFGDFKIYIKDTGFDIKEYLSDENAEIIMSSGNCAGRTFQLLDNHINPKRVWLAIKETPRAESYGTEGAHKTPIYYAIKREIQTITDEDNGNITAVEYGMYDELDSQLSNSGYKKVPVWRVDLKRSEDDALGIVYPNNRDGCDISGELREGFRYGDTTEGVYHSDIFVLNKVDMPSEFIKVASKRLFEVAKEYLADNNHTRYTYSIKLDSIFMQKNYDVLRGTSLRHILKEGRILHFYDDDLDIVNGDTTTKLNDENWYIESLTIKESGTNLPEYNVTLAQDKKLTTMQKLQGQIITLNIRTNQLQNNQSSVTTSRNVASTTIVNSSSQTVSDSQIIQACEGTYVKFANLVGAMSAFGNDEYKVVTQAYLCNYYLRNSALQSDYVSKSYLQQLINNGTLGSGGSGGGQAVIPIDNLTSNDATAPLSANMGRELKSLIDTKADASSLSSYALASSLNNYALASSLSNYYTKTECDSKYLTSSGLTTNRFFVALSASVTNINNKFSDYYTKSEVDDLIEDNKFSIYNIGSSRNVSNISSSTPSSTMGVIILNTETNNLVFVSREGGYYDNWGSDCDVSNGLSSDDYKRIGLQIVISGEIYEYNGTKFVKISNVDEEHSDSNQQYKVIEGQYTILDDDNNKLILYKNTTAITVYLPLNPVDGFSFKIKSIGGYITIATQAEDTKLIHSTSAKNGITSTGLMNYFATFYFVDGCWLRTY